MTVNKFYISKTYLLSDCGNDFEVLLSLEMIKIIFWGKLNMCLYKTVDRAGTRVEVDVAVPT